MIVSTFGFAGSPGSPSFVRVELRIERGILFRISGISSQAAKASAARIRSALISCGHRWPGKAITVNLAPADNSRTSTAFDLPIALAVLASSGIIPASSLTNIAAAGELGLDGTLRPWAASVFGNLDAFSTELSDVKNIRRLLAPSIFEGMATAIRLSPFRHLSEVIAFLKSHKRNFDDFTHSGNNENTNRINRSLYPHTDTVTFDNLEGENTAKRLAVIASAGSHDVIMLGPPGSGKSVLARCIHSLLPNLSESEFAESSSIHAAAGLLLNASSNRPPWKAPHSSTNMNGLIGSWSKSRGRGAIPGSWSLAHNGVLFLDEFAEFNRSALEACRAPLESRIISLSRAEGSVELPAAALFIGAMNPCPCGRFTGKRDSCVCSASEIKRYKKKISGPIADRIAIHLEMGHDLNEGFGSKSFTWDEARSAVSRVRSWLDNHPGEKRFECGPQLSKDASELLRSCRTVLKLSHRGLYHVKNVALTAALIDESSMITNEHIAESGASRLFDRQDWVMELT
ncbi:MAG: ATP-binding protein [Flavobacteriales bacterium]